MSRRVHQSCALCKIKTKLIGLTNCYILPKAWGHNTCLLPAAVGDLVITHIFYGTPLMIKISCFCHFGKWHGRSNPTSALHHPFLLFSAAALYNPFSFFSQPRTDQHVPQRDTHDDLAIRHEADTGDKPQVVCSIVEAISLRKGCRRPSAVSIVDTSHCLHSNCGFRMAFAKSQI